MTSRIDELESKIKYWQERADEMKHIVQRCDVGTPERSYYLLEWNNARERVAQYTDELAFERRCLHA